jgi:hypothetical protein
VAVPTSWQKIEIPFSNYTILNPSIVTQPLIVGFSDGLTGGNETIFLDCIGFE